MDPRKTRRIRRFLHTEAGTGRTVTYGTLMERFHLSRGRPLTSAIGGVDKMELNKGAPGFAAIVVRKDTGFPGGGYFCDDDLPSHLRRPKSRANDSRVSPAEREHIIVQQKKIWAFYGRPTTSSRTSRPARTRAPASSRARLRRRC